MLGLINSTGEGDNVFTFVGLFVSLSVNKITQKVVNGISPNLVWVSGVWFRHESIRFWE